jgi:hypothetical protein
MIYLWILTKFTSRQDAIMNHESCCLFSDQKPSVHPVQRDHLEPLVPFDEAE